MSVGETSQTLADKKVADNRQTDGKAEETAASNQSKAKFRSGNA